MSEKDILKFLQNLGFSKREIQVYMFLAKSGAQSTSFVAKRLKMERVQAYRTFKKLQEKGFIEATLERPTRFTVVPFQNLLESFIDAKKGEIESLNEQKDDLLGAWRSLSAPESEYTVAKFSVISGKKKIHVKMLNMIEEARKDIYVLTTGNGLVQEDLGGIFDELFKSSKKRDIAINILAEISKENLKVMERIDRLFSDIKENVELRHLRVESKYFPRFLIKDDEEAILYASLGDETSVLNIEDEGLWINDRMFISILKAFFSQMWHTGVEASNRMEEIRTGVPIGETIVIKNPQESWKKIEQILKTARDVILITSSQSLNNLSEEDPFQKCLNDGVKFRIMAPVDLDNLDAAKKLSEKYEVKHVSINYMTMMLVDNLNLFMFKSPPINDLSEEALYLSDTFFTNDPKSSTRVNEMLNDTWKRGIELSEITRQAGMELPKVLVSVDEQISRLASAFLKNNVKSILITEKDEPIGIINDRDVLKEIVENKKDPERNLVRDLEYTPLISLDAQETMTDAIKKARHSETKKVAIIKDGQLLGMLTK